MSLLHWLSNRKKSPADLPLSVMSSGLSRMESTKPFHAARAGGSAQPANRKQERMARREVLYAVVREAMVRAGVLSSSYKFKVLSLDPRGRQFLVMVDLSGDASTTRLAELEAMIAQSAKARYDILVSAVYWRANEHVAVGDPAPANSARPVAPPAAARATGPAPASEPPARAGSQRAGADKFEPLHADEIAAFRQALDAGARGEQALAAANQGKAAAPASYTLLTGFEDTEMADNGVDEHLSGTQWGTLR